MRPVRFQCWAPLTSCCLMSILVRLREPSSVPGDPGQQWDLCTFLAFCSQAFQGGNETLQAYQGGAEASSSPCGSGAPDTSPPQRQGLSLRPPAATSDGLSGQGPSPLLFSSRKWAVWGVEF